MDSQNRKAASMVSALNYYKFDKGSVKGFFDLRYHGMTVKSCRLMHGQNGYWIGLPSDKVEKDGATKYVDRVELTRSEADHIRRLVIADLEAQGHIAHQGHQAPTRQATKQPAAGAPRYVTPDGEDLSDCCTVPGDDIPF